MSIFICTHLNGGSLKLPIRGTMVHSSSELPTGTTAGIEVGHMIGAKTKHNVVGLVDGELVIVSSDPGPFESLGKRAKSYVHVFTGAGSDFDQFVNAVMAYKDGRPLYSASREFSPETFAVRR